MIIPELTSEWNIATLSISENALKRIFGTCSSARDVNPYRGMTVDPFVKH